MARDALGQAIRGLFTRIIATRAGSAPDAQLLQMFVERREEGAFEALLRRHGPMVLGVCERVLRHADDAEDAFQATFLILAQKATSIRRTDSLAAWLYGVAYHTATRARAAKQRAKILLRRAMGVSPPMTMHSPETISPAELQELQAALDDELRRLPEKYRVPIILCHLEGKTHDEAAKELGWAIGTLSGRLSRAREMLRTRLTRRGLMLSAVALATGLSPSIAQAALSDSLIASTTQAAGLIAAGKAVGASIVSAQAIILSKGVVQAMTITKLKLAAVVLIGVGIVGTGTGVVAFRAAPGDDSEAKQGADPKSPARVADLAKEDKEKLQGMWVGVSAEREGKAAPQEEIEHFMVKVQGDQIIFNPETEKRVSTFRLDPSTKPKTIYLTPQDGPGKGTESPMIYSLEGKQFKLCGNNSQQGNLERPTEFVTKPRSDLVMIVLQRLPEPKNKAEEAKRNEGLEKTREAANRTRSANNMRQIGIAMHMYQNEFGQLPPAVVYGKNGKPLYSWRVLLLPYLEQDAVYRAFKRDEPWDSEHNKKLLTPMPKVYAPPGVKTKEPHSTFYRVLVGNGAAFEERAKSTLFDMKDGTSNTILLVEAGEPVPWTKPDEVRYEAEKPLPKLGGLFKDGFNALFADGSTHFITRKADEQDLRAAITRDGKEHLEREKLSR